MKFRILSVFLILLGGAIAGCGAGPSSAASPESPTAQDLASLQYALRAAGATVESGDPITQPFFTPEGHTVKVNGADVQVFEYDGPEAMEKEASQVAPDGGSIGTSMVSWMDTPHFYKAERIIVLYVGSDKAVLDLLNKVLGPQFAGG